MDKRKDLGGHSRAAPCVILTDHPWPDVEIERGILEEAGLRLVSGPQEAPSAIEVEAMVREHDPVAILTCWAEVSEAAVAVPQKLAIVGRLGVGLDNIAVDAVTQRGGWVTNVPDYCVSEVSDHAIALMLAHFRGIVRSDRAIKQGRWVPEGAGLERISDLTVGLIGYGRIGRETARKLKAFGCNVLASNSKPAPSDDWVQSADLATIAREADVVIVHAPLTERTRGMLDDAFFDSCVRSPLLINVSRGPLVDNDALVRALDAGQLRGAALDVIDGEPDPPHLLRERSDVIATPHIAFLSPAALAELRRRACEEVVRVLAGQPPLCPCNEPLAGTPIDGGVASDIRLVETDDGPIVVKRALAKLKVAAEWFSDPQRSAVEVAAIDAFKALLGPESVPEIVWVRPEEKAFAMRRVDERLRNWKQDLLQGRLDLATAKAAGRLLGEAHLRSQADPVLSQRFADRTFFEELRIQPFFRKVADALPDVHDTINAVIDTIEERRAALVHGDYSPKNILADGDDLVILDFEVAHWGDPHFDVAFCISHLFLKGLRSQADPAAFARLIGSFLAAYREAGPPIDEAHLARLTACLVLARFHGSSPVDYRSDIDESRATAIAIAVLRARQPSISASLLKELEPA